MHLISKCTFTFKLPLEGSTTYFFLYPDGHVALVIFLVTLPFTQVITFTFFFAAAFAAAFAGAFAAAFAAAFAGAFAGAAFAATGL